jgi:hypothetical protein
MTFTFVVHVFGTLLEFTPKERQLMRDSLGVFLLVTDVADAEGGSMVCVLISV